MVRNVGFFASLVLVLVMATGCTGTRLTVSPLPDANYPLPTAFQSLGVKEIPADKVYPPAGHPTQGFAREIELSGISRSVYYPMRPDDQVDAVLETKIDVTMDPHMGGLMVKSFLTGFTLFLLEPVFWYDFDYRMVGRVDVIQGGQRRTLQAETQARIGMKWLSLGQAQNLELDALAKSKQSLYRQLIEEVRKAK